MTPEQRAREFVESGFRDLGVPSLEPYIEIITELLVGAVDNEREACAKVAEWVDHGEQRPKAKAANDRIAAAIRARSKGIAITAIPSPATPVIAEQETK